MQTLNFSTCYIQQNLFNTYVVWKIKDIPDLEIKDIVLYCIQIQGALKYH